MTQSQPSKLERTGNAKAEANEQILRDRLMATRRASLELAAPLTAEDMTVQAMEDASPTKWHLAHVTWFFETFVLKPHLADYREFDSDFAFLFNSYYESFGARQARPARGLMTRPPVSRIIEYRHHVDEALERLIASDDVDPRVAKLIEIGINHEQQHQELLLTDILALFAANVLKPAYRDRREAQAAAEIAPAHWLAFDGGISSIGNSGDAFCWDNETPRHQMLAQPFHFADRLITNAEWREFIEDGGYRNALLWLSDGWAHVIREGWTCPLYWEMRDGAWWSMTLEGNHPINPAAPVAHVSYFEAEAFAHWSGRRLPTEFEWEIAAAALDRESGAHAERSFATRPAPSGAARHRPRQMYSDVWQWTSSAYSPYPGYRAPEGALGEYNGKFMVSQQTLRGASFATPPGHAR